MTRQLAGAGRAVARVRRRGRSQAVPPGHATAEMVDREVDELLRTDGPIVVGPWLSELGFEVLYWIPFLTDLQARHGIPRERLVVVSRGGTRAWYEHLAADYLDLLEAFTPEEWRDHTERRWAAAGGQKQIAFGPFDQEAIGRVGIPVGAEGRGVLHPSLMYRSLRLFWRERKPVAEVLERLAFRRFPAPAYDLVEDRLPAGDFFAVKFYARPSFPSTPENQQAIDDLVDRLSRVAPVVSLDTGLQLDDHREFAIGAGAGQRVTSVLQDVPPSRNLEAQSAVIARSTAFFGTYGGLSYLAPAHGVPSFAYASASEHFLTTHLDLARRAARTLGASLTVVDGRRRTLWDVVDGA